MAKKTEVSSEEYAKLNQRLVPYNIIIAGISIIVSICLFVGNFWEIKVSIPVQKDFIESMLSQSASAIGQEENNEVEQSAIDDTDGDDTDDIDDTDGDDTDDDDTDIDDTDGDDTDGDDTDDDDTDDGDNTGGDNNGMGGIGELDFSMLEDFEISLSVTIKSSTLIKSVFDDPVKLVFKDVVKSLTDEIPAMLKTIIKALVKVSAQTAIKTAISAAAEAGADENAIPAEVTEALDIDAIGDVVGNLLSGDINSSEAKAEFMSVIEEAVQKAVDDGLISAEEGNNAIEEATSKIDETIDTVMDEFGETSEDGAEPVINIDKTIYSLIGSMLELDENELTDEKLSESITDLIVESIPESTNEIIKYVILGIGILLLVTIGAWVLLFLKTVLRTIAKNKRVGLGLAGFFGLIPYFIFVLAPTILIKVAASVAGNAVEGAGDIMAGMSITFSSITIVAFIGSIALMLISIFGYGRRKRAVKRAKPV